MDPSIYNIIESRQKSSLTLDRIRSKTKSIHQEPTFDRQRSKSKSLLKEPSLVRQGTLLLRESVKREATTLQNDKIPENDEKEEQTKHEHDTEREHKIEDVFTAITVTKKYNFSRFAKPKPEFKLTDEEKEKLEYTGRGAPTKDWYEKGLEHFRQEKEVSAVGTETNVEETIVEQQKDDSDSEFESDFEDDKDDGK